MGLGEELVKFDDSESYLMPVYVESGDFRVR